MPAGAKKRRAAAKKKKENQSNNHSNPPSASAHSHGNQSVKQHDEKYSDVGEVSSPGTQDHLNPSTDGEEEEIEKKKNFSNHLSTERLKINESVEIEDKSDRKNGRVMEHDESMRKSYNGGSFSCCSNSSDDGAHGIKNSRATEDEIYSFSERWVEAIQSVPIEQVKVESLQDGKIEKNPSCVERANVQSVEKTATILNQNVFAMQETDDRLTFPYDNRVEQEKECAVTEPLLVPSPCPEKKTSWKSCCGLFEVFSGSGR